MTTKTEEPKKRSWEKRSAIFVLRACGFLFFMAYLLSAVPVSYDWARMEWIRSQDITKLETIAKEYIAKNNPKGLWRWIAMRPREDRALIQKTLEPLSGQISSLIFMTYSEWAFLEDRIEDAVFWRQYARFRLRYDALRCGAPEGAENMNGLIDLAQNQWIQDYINENPKIVKKSLKDVLAFDAKHPAENNPVDICPTLAGIEGGKYIMLGRERWRAIRHSLRAVTQHYIDKPETAPKPAVEEKKK